ncbi:MAG: orotidine-5'-phosphate decarboxylase [Alphaproteobacteria bacterium]|nr:MAG: orotidine-5'-phosphate decarboxylase [Alphaproteobacteria bacterium]
MTAKNRVICAIDTDDIDFASKLAKDLKDHVGGFKLGLEFFTSHGPQGIAKIQGIGMPIMLDLKFHDIPNTVSGAVRAATKLNVAMMTIHTGGSSDMMRQAADAAMETAAKMKIEPPKLLGVTVLTSLDDEDLTELGYKQKATDRVRRLAEMAQLCGLNGVVASARELNLLQDQRSKDFLLVTPGIRPSWSADAHDQKRTLEPADAIKAGSDYLVVGRPITRAKDPVDAAKRIVQEIGAVL